jgi:5'(3')-deoxyribonucleotidase
MERRLNIGVDVDGVLADFTSAARKLMKQMFNGRPDDKLVQTTWAFESLGINAQEERQFWNRIDTIPNWWLGHEPLPKTDLLSQLCEKHRVIFITNRKDGMGMPVEDQTKVWLKRTFGIVYTNVIISDNKGPVAEGLKLNAFIDDRPKNVSEVYPKCPGGTYILRTTYNQEFCQAPAVLSFNDFAKLILEAQ